MLELYPISMLERHDLFKAEQTSCSGVAFKGSIYESTLATAKTDSCLGSIFYVASWPFKFLGTLFASLGIFLKNYILCCCRYGPAEERLDWGATKKAFYPIVEALEKENAISCEKAFKKGFDGLSKAAHERFSQHVYFAIAELYGEEYGLENKTERSVQEKFAREYRTKISLSESYFSRFENVRSLKVLRLAARNFKNEIDRNT